MPGGRTSSNNDLAILSGSANRAAVQGESPPPGGVALDDKRADAENFGRDSNSGSSKPFFAEKKMKADADADLRLRQQANGNIYNNSADAQKSSQLGANTPNGNNGPLEIDHAAAVRNGSNSLADGSPVADNPNANPTASDSIGSMAFAAAAPASRPASVTVLLVSSDDPVLTANLLIGGLAQDNVRFERTAVPDPAFVGDELGEASEAGRVLRLNAPAVVRQSRAQQPSPVTLSGLDPLPRPVLIPGASDEKRVRLWAMLNSQRPGRQSARWIGDDSGGRAHAMPTTSPTKEMAVLKDEPALSPTGGGGGGGAPGAMAPGAAAGDTAAGDAAAANGSAAGRKAIENTPTTRPTSPSATRPTTQEAVRFGIGSDGQPVPPSSANGPAGSPPGDLLVVVVHARPAATRPATAPATLPGLGDVP